MYDERRYYQVREYKDGFQVVDRHQHCVIQCRDENSAGHYMSLLNQAFYVGFKQGYKQAK